MQLANHVIVITGGFGQLGRAMTAEALAQGARVALSFSPRMTAAKWPKLTPAG